MRKYNCPYCNERFYKEDLSKHIEKKHDELIPDNYTAYHLTYDIVNNKQGHGNCTECGSPTKWNEKRQKYERLCGNPKCYARVKETYQKRMLKVYNKIHLLDDPVHQEKMLAARKISGKYKWSDGKEFTYTGQYEKKLMEFLDKTMEFKSNEVLAPGPILEYEFQGKKLHWITDFLLLPYNLIIEVKDGGDNPNKRNMPITRSKTLAKEKMITSMGKYSYLRLTNNDFLQLFQILAELKEKSLDDNEDPIYRIHEDTEVLDEGFLDSIFKDLKIKKIEKTTIEDRKKIVDKVNKIAKDILDKINKKAGKKFITFYGFKNIDKQEITNFINGEQSSLWIGSWDIWKYTKEARTCDISVHNKFYDLLYDITREFSKVYPDKRFFLTSAGGDWDDGPISLVDVTLAINDKDERDSIIDYIDLVLSNYENQLLVNEEYSTYLEEVSEWESILSLAKNEFNNMDKWDNIFTIDLNKRLIDHPHQNIECYTICTIKPKDSLINKEYQDKFRRNINKFWMENIMAPGSSSKRSGWNFTSFYEDDDKPTDGWNLVVYKK